MRDTLSTNEARLAEISALGQVSAPLAGNRWRLSPEGQPTLLPGVGGITYNCKVGDSALEWAVDHVEPGVSLKNEDEKKNTALNTLACVGNRGWVVSGDAKGDEGLVTGKHGGVEHVIMDFPDETLRKLVIGDKIQIRTQGLGLKLIDMPRIKVMNLDPALLEKMAPERRGEILLVKVAHRIPAALMGSGLGRAHVFTGDYDMQLSQPIIEEYNLEQLRLGDLVAVDDADNTYGRAYQPGAISIGVVVHCRCTQAGHGPGLTSLMSSREGKIEPVVDPAANIADLLLIGRKRAT